MNYFMFYSVNHSSRMFVESLAHAAEVNIRVIIGANMDLATSSVVSDVVKNTHYKFNHGADRNYSKSRDDLN